MPVCRVGAPRQSLSRVSAPNQKPAVLGNVGQRQTTGLTGKCGGRNLLSSKNYFRSACFTGGSSLYPFTPLHLGPCLAYNCNRYQTSSFREKTEYLCQNFIQPHAHILCCLGEIEIRVHVFMQAALQGRTYRQIVDDILVQYIEFLLRLKAQGYQVSCWGPIASQSESCPMDIRFPRSGTEEDRNRATEYFNRQLARLCRKHGMLFLSIFDKMITSDYQTQEQYLSPAHCHLGQEALSLALPEWQKLLQAVPNQSLQSFQQSDQIC